MKYSFSIILWLIVVSAFSQDVKRCENSEPKYLNRMQGFYIRDCNNSEYNEHDFIYYEKGVAKKVRKGGKYYEVWYAKSKEETRKISNSQVKANYINAFLKAKGKSLSSETSSEPVMTASFNGKEVWVQLVVGTSTDLSSYHLFCVEADAMKQEIEVNLQESIDTDGKVAIYGILFDVGKSDIKPESSEALSQIINYLNTNSSVKIIVVGHTDNSGTFASNITLSKARAQSIKNYLVSTGKIQESRLIAEGVGQCCPISTNSTEEGRKLNRRVEIVKQ